MTVVQTWYQYHTIASVLTVAAVLLASFTDLRRRSIPNWLTLGSALIGLALRFVEGGLSGAGDSAAGWLMGCTFLFLPFALGGMGAGDVKLLGAVGALGGPHFVFYAFVYTAFLGAAASLVVLAREGRLRGLAMATARWLWRCLRCVVQYQMLPPMGKLALSPAGSGTGEAGHSKAKGMPYGVAIAAGSLLALLLGS
jgi:prepilin peptidase CpaA